MAVTATLSNKYKYALMKKLIDLSADSIKILLMRSGFTFDKDVHEKKINLMTNSGAISITFAGTAKTITKSGGTSFITTGFVAGNQITTDATLNPGPFTILTVAADVITVVGTDTVLDEGPVTKTITSNDELATNYGYTRDTKVLATLVLTEDDTNDRGEMTCADVTWTASGGTIGPTPGAILYDDSDGTTPDCIIGYLNFGSEQQAAAGADFTLSNIKIRTT